MKKDRATFSFEFLGEHFRVSRYFGSELIEIEKLVKRRFRNSQYERFYFGHPHPLEEALSLFTRIKSGNEK